MTTQRERVLVFRGPAHHAQLLRPVEDALERRGVEVVRYTADTEAAFQIGLAEELGIDGWRWLPEWCDEREAQRLYRSHAEWFRERLLESSPLALMLPQVMDRIVMFCCREWVATRAMLRDLKPTRCLALHEINRWGAMLGALAQKQGIPYYTLQEGLCYGDSWIYAGCTTTSRALVWGEATRAKFLRAGCGGERVEVWGHPDLGARLARGRDEATQLWAELPPAAQGKRLVFVFLAHVRVLDQAQGLLEGLEGSEWFVVVRAHHLASLPEAERLKAVFMQCPSNCTFSELPLAHHWRLMAAAELALVVGCSTTMVEWCFTGKPVGQVRTTGRMDRDFAAEGVAVSCDGLTVREAVEKVVRDWPQHREAARRFVEGEVAAGDAAEALAGRVLR